MAIQQSEQVMADTFIDEHDRIFSQSSQAYDLMNAQIKSLKNEVQDNKFDLAAVEKIIAWKSTLKEILWHLAEYMKDHIERETALLDSYIQRKIDPEALKRNEDVLEHLDELAWLLDNTPARKMHDFISYIKQKMDELNQGVREHCQWGSQVLKLLNESE